MKPELYRSKWEEMKPQESSADAVSHLCTGIALSFLDRYYYNDTFSAEYIDLLCEMATCGDDKTMSAASSALFGIVIESLCDDFEELQTEAYNRVMSRIISFCRTIPAGKDIDASLSGFGLHKSDDIYRRIEKIRRDSDTRRSFGNLKKIIVLSRVTIGADVAVTSVIIGKLMRLFPKAEIVLVGSSKLESVFSGNPRLRIRNLGYTRRGGLLERISAWHDVLGLVHSETEGCDGEYLLVDTDSRLSQLGVLPLVDDSHYLFFNSRGSDSYPKKVSMAELANFWIGNVFADSEFCFPGIWIPDEIVWRGRQVLGRIRANGCEKIISVNFGVGGNDRKRIEGDFEFKLLARLLVEPRTVIILDKGFGKEELLRSEVILDQLKSLGFNSLSAIFPDVETPPGFNHGVIGFSTDIGEAASLISASDEYIGYDSACQHIAAAAQIPLCTIFAGSNNTRFVRRWRAFGQSRTELIHVDTLSHSVHFGSSDIIDRIMSARKQ